VLEVEPQNGRIDATAEVIEIRREERATAVSDEALEQAALLERVGKVPVTRGVLAR
jgi:hypothetical protein